MRRHSRRDNPDDRSSDTTPCTHARAQLVCAQSVSLSFVFSWLCVPPSFLLSGEKMSKRGAADDQSDRSGGSNLSLLPEVKDSAAAISAVASAAAAAAAASAPPPPRPDSPPPSDDDMPGDAASEHARLRGRLGGRFGGRRGRARNAAADDSPAVGRGFVMGHATADSAPDLRLGELERLFAV